jgi:flagellar hook-associated protein 1 FlgK
MDSFFNAFSNLAANPTDTGAQDTVYQTAGTLATTINSAYSQLGSLQSNINTQIGQDVGAANGLLQNIATLNGQIQLYQVESPNSTANDLIDQRQADLQQLAQYMNFTTASIPNSNGQIEVTAVGADSNPVTLVDKTNASTVAFDGSSFSAGGKVLGLTGGSMQGELSASTGPIQQLMGNLATTATQLTQAVNAIYNPSNPDGTEGPYGNFFATTSSNGLASGDIIDVDNSVTANSVRATNTGGSGANDVASGIAGVATQSFSTSNGFTGSVGQFYSQAVTGLGESIDGVQSQLSDQNTVLTMVKQQQSSVSGVNEDQEVTNLMTYQRAFQAQAQVVSTLNAMLGMVVNGLFGGTMSGT